MKPPLGFWGMSTDTEGRFRGHYLDGVGTDLVFNGELDPKAGEAVRRFALYRALLKDVHAGDRDVRLVASPIAADAELQVLALDPEGWPLPGVLIQAHQGRSAPQAFAESDESGRVTFRNLARWPLSVTAQLLQQPSTRFLRAEPLTGVFPGGVPVEVRFVEFPSVMGRVVDEAGQPVARAWCAVLREGSIVACFGTDTQGRFRDCPNVPAGTRIQVTARYPMENWTSLGLLDAVEAGSGDLTVVVRPIAPVSRRAR